MSAGGAVILSRNGESGPAVSFFDALPDRIAIVDAEALAADLAALGESGTALRRAATAVLKAALERGRAEIGARLVRRPGRGLEAANAQAYLIDTLLAAAWTLATTRLHPIANPTAGERVAVLAVGGYGRGEMAPFSDVDIAFVTPWKRSAWAEQVIESVLYTLWDMGLEVGHSTRTIDETMRLAQGDVTIRTALLESRPVCGEGALAAEVARRFGEEVQRGTERQFVADKLAERNARHLRMGDSRYVVEPNVKEGKGGLRDLHALFWIGKYVHDVARAARLVDARFFTADEYRLFHRADEFLWAVRCHLHAVAGRAEDRLTFDLQRQVAARMRFADRPARPAVERFMQAYFLHVRTVGVLTGVFLSHFEERFAARGWFAALPRLRRRPRRLRGFVLTGGRLALPSDDFLRAEPVRLLELFQLADLHALEIHPLAMRAAARDARLADTLRDDPRANALFLDVLASPRDPEGSLRAMNEAGVLGRFVPDFARVVAQTQFDMYHHYTVDEHTIRAVGLLARIERGELKDEHPLSSAVIGQVVSRRALYVAVLLHDIAKGRGGDHSMLGAEVAERLCPRFGLSAAETETVAWLVRHHLLMAATAFKRDLSDAKTVLDFAGTVQSAERLRMLLVLSVVDIRAVGPTTWNGWKRQLLRELFEAAEEVLRLGHKQRGRGERVAAKQRRLADALGWNEAAADGHLARLPDSYWLAESDDVLAANARLVVEADPAGLSIGMEADPERGATLLTVHTADHPGLFFRIAGAIHLGGGSIIDARIHTTHDGMALDNLLVQDARGRPFAEAAQIGRLRSAVAAAIAERDAPDGWLDAGPRMRTEAFAVQPNVLVENRASNRFTVVEVNARDRPALLGRLAYALFRSGVTIHSAHVATYGERAVDTFYLTDLTGAKLAAGPRLRALEKRLLDAAAGRPLDPAA